MSICMRVVCCCCGCFSQTFFYLCFCMCTYIYTCTFLCSTGYHEVPTQSQTVISSSRQITDGSTVTGPAVLPEKPGAVPTPAPEKREEKNSSLTATEGVIAYIETEYKFIVTVTLSVLTLVGALYYFPKVSWPASVVL